MELFQALSRVGQSSRERPLAQGSQDLILEQVANLLGNPKELADDP